MKRSPRHALAALVAAAALLAACGDDDDAGTSAPTTERAGGAATDAATTAVTVNTTAPPSTTAGSTVTSGTSAGSAGTTPATVDAEDDEYVDALVAELQIADADVGECTARGVLQGVGFDVLRAAGVTPEELAGSPSLSNLGVSVDPADVPAMSSAVAACGNLHKLLFAGEEKRTRNCAAKHVTNDVLASVAVTQLAGVPPTEEALAAQSKFQACLGGG